MLRIAMMQTYGNSDVDNDIGTDEAISHVRRMFGYRLHRQGDGTIDQEWLAKRESDETCSRYDYRKQGPLQHPQGHRKERAWSFFRHYRRLALKTLAKSGGIP